MPIGVLRALSPNCRICQLAHPEERAQLVLTGSLACAVYLRVRF